MIMMLLTVFLTLVVTLLCAILLINLRASEKHIRYELKHQFGVAALDRQSIDESRCYELRQPKNVHFSPSGSQFLADRWAAAIADELP
jgi:lysophospholipase L1-like esterase